ncbi:hypothetical protein AAS86_000759 [Escherichia coli]|nr:hypothetical protein [Escherichia coli]
MSNYCLWWKLYLNSLRRVLFYGDDKCTSESQVNGMENRPVTGSLLKRIRNGKKAKS